MHRSDRRAGALMGMLIVLALAAAASFDPLAFFAGRTEGAATLRIILHHPRAVHVHGTGRPTADGLILDQRVEQEGKPATTRRWVLRRVAPGRYTGTLTGARGPVTAETLGDRLHIAYRTAGKIRIEQWLTLGPDGQSARNHLTARRLGVVVGRLDETIRRVRQTTG